MKKVAILSLHLGYGGIEKSICALANLLCSKYKVEIICTYKLYEKPAFALNDEVTIKYLVPDYKPNRNEVTSAIKGGHFITAFKEGLRSLKILHLRKKTMIDYIKNSDADIIISTRDIFNEWLGEYGADSILKIGWEHNHYHGDYNYAHGVVRSAIHLDYLVLVSDALRKYYKKELRTSQCKCVFIPNILDSIPKTSASLNEKRLISVGRLSSEKGYLDLLRIFSVLVKKHSDWHLDIIGDGDQRSILEEYISTHHLNDFVTLHGFQGKDYIDKLLHKSSIYVMTSYTESFGIVLIEAMSHGLPCVAFDSAEGAKELINSGMNGYLIKNRNMGAMIKKIEDLMMDKEARKKIGAAGRKSVKKFAGDVVKEQWFDILEK
ncbi:MAG: glycosyltransferase [bacterium]|nr:glycosyltransferase [bacterium]